jgi:UDP-N-acetylmuramoyl-L-alanyl-D-glutamate--2,6-diaminopimelate ligase
VVGDPATEITGVTYDSREAQPGMLFAALRGSDFDGHAYIPAAIERGASAILAEEVVDTTVPVILVENSRAALAPIAAAFYGNPSRELTLIGLTGTDGKTTTSYLVRQILESAGLQTGVIGTVGIEVGDGTSHHLPHQTTPESNLVQGYLREMVEHGTTHAVIEATSHGLAMHRLDGTAFGIAGVTNITHEHLEYHGTIEN